jgi:hypothetical protein
MVELLFCRMQLFQLCHDAQTKDAALQLRAASFFGLMMARQMNGASMNGASSR